MKRFALPSLGLLVCLSTVVSSAHAGPFAALRNSSGDGERHQGGSDQPPRTAPDVPVTSSLGQVSEVRGPGSGQWPPPLVSRRLAEPATGVWAAYEDSAAPHPNGVAKSGPELLRTLFAENPEQQTPLILVPDEEPARSGPESLGPADESGAMTLKDLEQMALAWNPTLQQAAAVVQKARGIRQQVGLYPNPTVGYAGQEVGDSNTAGQQGGFIGQTIVTGHKLQLNQDVASWDIQELSWAYQAQQYRVLNDVRLRYFDVLGAQRRVSIAEDLVHVAEVGAKAAEDLFEAKQGARPDVLQARVDLNEVRIILQNARYDYDAAWKQLASVLGQPELVPPQLSGSLQEEVPEYEWETMHALLLERSPELQAAYTRVQRAKAQIRRQKAQPVPNVQAQVGVMHDNISDFDEVNVQVGIPLPIFNRNQGNIATSYAEYHRTIRDVERMKLGLRNRLAVAFRDMQQSSQQVARYQQDIIPTAKENLDLTEEGYQQGEFDFLRVLTARRTYFETNLRYVQSLIAWRKADVILSGLLLTGGLNDVRDINGGARRLRGMALGGQ